MAWRLVPGKPMQDEFSRVALREAKRARSLLSSSEPPSPEAVHQARRSFKKLRSLVRLARPSLGKSFMRENHRWRDAGRLLSASRDAAVLLGTFDRIAEQAQCSGNDAARLRDWLGNGEQPGVPKRDGAEPTREVLAALEAAIRDIPDLPWPSNLDCLERGLRDSQSRLKRRWKAARQNPHSDKLHDWRKRVKDMGSQLGLFRDALSAELKETRNTAKALAELLGEEHDLALLHEKLSAKSLPSELRGVASRLMEAVEARRSKLRASALESGKAVSMRPPKSAAKEIVSEWTKPAPLVRNHVTPEAEGRRA